MYGAALGIGIALLVMGIALLAMWRRERLYGPTPSRAWRAFHRLLTVLLVGFALYMVVGAVVTAATYRD